MRVAVLGPLLVRVQDRDVTPNGQRLRDAFVVLLQRRGRPVPAEVLLSLLWGDRAGDPGVSAVHSTVARLRKRLGQVAIVSRDFGYLVDASVTTDEDQFGDLLTRARDLVGRGDHAAATADYQEALALWRGWEAFEDVRAELVEADRSRLEELRASAIEELAALLLDRPDSGGPAEALLLVSGLIGDQPLRERPYQLAMLAAYRSQRQADALELFQTLRRRLRSDLGIEPAAATAELQSRILRQDPALDEPAPTRRRPSVISPRAHRLPAPVNPLIGRERELATLVWTLDNGRRLITLIGPGGVDKSRLLVDLGVRRQDLVDINYAELSGLDAAGHDVAEAIFVAGAPGGSGSRPLDTLLAALGNDDHLLLVDEAEWVAGVLSAILHSCRGTQIVVTSRIPLNIAGEVLLAVEPLACPEPDAPPADIRSAPAVRLLAERLSDRGMTVDPDAADLLASIARRVDGLPLGLELAAGQASGRSLAELATLVESPLDVTATQRLQNSRHRSLRETLAWSLTRLEPPARAVLHRLSVFVGPFELDTARAVTAGVEPAADDVDSIVRSLARDALLHIERTSLSRINFRLLRTVRELAGEGLDPQQRLLAQALHRRWHAGLWRSGGDNLVDDVRAHLDDYLEALRSAVDSRDVTTLADLTITLSRFWQVVGGQATGLRWIGIVLDSDILGAGDRARVLVQRASLALHHDPAVVLADTAAAIPLRWSTSNDFTTSSCCWTAPRYPRQQHLRPPDTSSPWGGPASAPAISRAR